MDLYLSNKLCLLNLLITNLIFIQNFELVLKHVFNLKTVELNSL